MLKVIASLLIGYSIYSVYAVFTAQAYLGIIGAALALAAGLGLWLRKTWSQYCVYLLSFGFVVEWVWLTWRSFQMNALPKGALYVIISLFPGLCLVALCIGASLWTFSYFSRNKSTG